MHVSSSIKNALQRLIQWSCHRASALLLSLHTTLSAICNDAKKSHNYKKIRIISTVIIGLIANIPMIMLMAICLHLPFSIMQSISMLIFMAACEFLLFFTLWHCTAFFTTWISEAQEQYQTCLENLEENQKLAAIGRLSSSVNHEVNNPLGIIREKAGLAADIIEFSDDFPERERFTKLITSISKSVDRCQGITQRMLHFSRRKEAFVEEIHINELLTETLSFLERETTTRGIIASKQCQENIPILMSERGPLQQVFLNLLTNALAAVEDGGTIGFSTAFADKRVQVAIHDNGTGMSEEVLAKIFEPFFSTKGNKGTGLGMHITQSIISRLGGTITIASKLGHGTTITICLPLSYDNDHDETAPI